MVRGYLAMNHIAERAAIAALELQQSLLMDYVNLRGGGRTEAAIRSIQHLIDEGKHILFVNVSRDMNMTNLSRFDVWNVDVCPSSRTVRDGMGKVTLRTYDEMKRNQDVVRMCDAVVCDDWGLAPRKCRDAINQFIEGKVECLKFL